RVAWSYDPLEESEKAFGRRQSFVAGPPKNGVQFMVKDSKKYAATDGWGFAQFNDGKPADEAVHNACFSCHAIVKARAFIFNRYAPSCGESWHATTIRSSERSMAKVTYDKELTAF